MGRGALEYGFTGSPGGRTQELARVLGYRASLLLLGSRGAALQPCRASLTSPDGAFGPTCA
jgi:hypothetical protein